MNPHSPAVQTHQDRQFRTQLRYDIPAGTVLFLVSLPLCLGIALISGAPLFSGVIAGVVGALVVAGLSASSFGVSDPAAALATLVFTGIQDLGYQTFLLTLVLAGVIQIVMGLLAPA